MDHNLSWLFFLDTSYNSATLPGPETFLKRGPIDDRPEPWVVAGISGIGPILIDYSKTRPPTTIRIGPKIQAPGKPPQKIRKIKKRGTWVEMIVFVFSK